MRTIFYQDVPIAARISPLLVSCQLVPADFSPATMGGRQQMT